MGCAVYGTNHGNADFKHLYPIDNNNDCDKTTRNILHMNWGHEVHEARNNLIQGIALGKPLTRHR